MTRKLRAGSSSAQCAYGPRARAAGQVYPEACRTATGGFSSETSRATVEDKAVSSPPKLLRLPFWRKLNAAKNCLATSKGDPQFWESLIKLPGVVDFCQEWQASKVSSETCVLNLLHSIPTLPACNKNTKPKLVLEEVNGHPLLKRRKLLTKGSPGFGTEGSKPKILLEEATLLKRRRLLTKGSPSFGTESSKPKILLEEATLLKRRKLPTKSSPGFNLNKGTTLPHTHSASQHLVFGELTLELIAFVMSYVDFQTKLLGPNVASIHFKQAMDCHTAWDPLQLDLVVGRAFLRRLKCRDPLGCFSSDIARTKLIFPRALFEVRRFEMVLMDPDHVELGCSDIDDTSGPENMLQPQPHLIADPLDEVCKRLRNYFTSVCDLAILNIEDYRMDYRFVGLRTTSFADFGFIELVHIPIGPTNPRPTYVFRARRDAPPVPIDVAAAWAENRLRVPAGVHFDTATTISECEALYLAEHRSVYKNGEDFHLVNACYRTVRSHCVRRHYCTLLEIIKNRFPSQFRPDMPIRS